MKYILALCTLLCVLTLLGLSGCVQLPAPSKLVTEKEYYKMMYEQAALSAANATALTQWALGIVVGVVTIILAVQYFFSFRINEEKINTIQAEMGERAAAQENRLVADLQNTVRRLEDSLRLQISNDLNTRKLEIESLLDNRFNPLINSIDRNELNAIMNIVNYSIESNSKKEKHYASELFIRYAQTKITSEKADAYTILNLLGFLRNIKELTQYQVDIVRKLIPLTSKANFGGVSDYLPEALDNVTIIEDPTSLT